MRKRNINILGWKSFFFQKIKLKKYKKIEFNKNQLKKKNILFRKNYFQTNVFFQIYENNLLKKYIIYKFILLI